MKKGILAIIIILILATSLVKNSTKKIEDKTSAINENISLLNTELGDVMLEYNYLSSPEKLTKHQSQYFNKDLIEIDITKIKKIIINKDNLEIVNFIKSTKINLWIN